jgi:DNA-binding GntR family transcriptional regulator
MPTCVQGQKCIHNLHTLVVVADTVKFPMKKSPTASKRARRSSNRRGTAAEEQSLGDEVYLEVLRRIIRGDYPGGFELKTTHLARDLKVSRTPVLFALSRLISDGIVVQRRNMRAVVNIEAENWLLAIHELRELLEPQAAALAATRVSGDALKRLEKLAAAAEPFKASNWIKRSIEFDFALHLTIADNTGNEALRQAIHKCWRYKGLSYRLGANSPQVLARNHPEHLAILAGLQQRDPEVARAEMDEHLRNAATYRIGPKVV